MSPNPDVEHKMSGLQTCHNKLCEENNVEISGIGSSKYDIKYDPENAAVL